MIFRTLVENLLREPGDSLIVRSLTRELETDLRGAFQISRPLVDQYPDTFSQSRSFLDFLIQISKLPSYKEVPFQKENRNDRELQTCLESQQKEYKKLQEAYNLLQKELASKKKDSDLETPFQENSQLQKQLDECQKKLKNCEQERTAQQEEAEEAFKKSQEKYEKALKNSKKEIEEIEEKTAEALQTSKKNINTLEEELKASNQEIHKLKKETETLRERNENLKEKIQSSENHLKVAIQDCENTKQLELENTVSRNQKMLIEQFLQFYNSYQQIVEMNKDLIESNRLLQQNVAIIQDEKQHILAKGSELWKEHIHLAEQTNLLGENYKKLLGYTAEEAPTSTTSIERRVVKALPFGKPDDTHASQDVNMEDTLVITEVDPFSHFNQDIIDAFQEVYAEGESDWKTHALHKLPEDIKLFTTLKKQISQFEQVADKIKVTPENFAKAVLELYDKAPEYLSQVESYREAAGLHYANDELIRKILTMTKNLYTHFNKKEKIAYDIWVTKFQTQIENLIHLYDLEDWIKLHSECEKLADAFHVPLNPHHLSENILKSPDRINFYRLKTFMLEYFKLSTLFSPETNTNEPQLSIQTPGTSVSIYSPVLTFTQRIKKILGTSVMASTFEEQIEIYRQTVMHDWEEMCRSLLETIHKRKPPRESFKMDVLDEESQKTPFKEMFHSEILEMNQENIDWETFYQDCLNVLEMESTTEKSNFLAKLRVKVLKRSRKEEEEDIGEKKPRGSQALSIIELQNIFSALYQEYFKLKYLHHLKNLPTETEITGKIKEKLNILETVNMEIREGELLRSLLEYVTFDLSTYTGESGPFTKEVNQYDLLQKSMEKTHTHLDILFDELDTEKTTFRKSLRDRSPHKKTRIKP